MSSDKEEVSLHQHQDGSGSKVPPKQGRNSGDPGGEGSQSPPNKPSHEANTAKGGTDHKRSGKKS